MGNITAAHSIRASALGSRRFESELRATHSRPGEFREKLAFVAGRDQAQYQYAVQRMDLRCWPANLIFLVQGPY
jgi:hypothetical protein